MKRIASSLAVLAGLAIVPPAARPASAPPAQLAEIKVHASAGGRFLDDLRLADFELRENGEAQGLAGLALVRGGRIVRREGAGLPAARVERSYTLLFQAVDWDPKIGEAVDRLFGTVLQPGDALTLVTPVKPYYLQKDALAARSTEELSKSLQTTLRKDIVRGGAEYRDLINELKRLTRAIGAGGGTSSTFDEDLESDSSMESGSFGLEQQIDRYRASLMKLDAMRLVDEPKLLAFAGSLKARPGQKTVVLFYQREYRPELSASAMTSLMSLYQDTPDVLANLMDLFQFYKREKAFDAERVRKAFADAGIDFHFIFMEKKNQRVFGATMREQSEDTLPGFIAIARGTGGTYEDTPNPATGFKLAADVSSDYYILSYVPTNEARDGGFRTIDVKVGREGARVSFPAGYYAR